MPLSLQGYMGPVSLKTYHPVPQPMPVISNQVRRFSQEIFARFRSGHSLDS